MTAQVVTFDAANTLVRVGWSPGGFILDCARALGMKLGQNERIAYETALQTRWSEYQEVNLTRDPELCDAFWVRLTETWLADVGLPPSRSADFAAVAPQLLYGPDSHVFELFHDVIPTLDAIKAMGIRIGIISNWDYTLHRVIRYLNVQDRFEHVVASLEEGVEKPHPMLFELTLERFGVSPADAVHVGDDPLDDLRGAKNAGMRAFLLDRRQHESRGAILARLTDLAAALDRA